MVQDLQDFFYQTNLDCFHLATIKELTTKALSENERKSTSLDYLTGFEILDGDFRLFVFEGLSDQAMKRLDQSIGRIEPNSDLKKILKNPEIRFESRLYDLFNTDLKKIRLKGHL
jgi:hypothetical protein